jgi:MFS family permease
VLAALVFEVGAILQLFPNGGVATWYAGRVIAGVGIGIATVIVPLYTAEMAPKSIRGQLGSMFQFFFTLGVMTSYWVDYGVSKMPSSTKQWRIPVGLQLIPGGVLCMGMLLVKESTRWLAKTGRHDEAMASLIWVRGGDSPEIHEEWVLICPSKYHVPTTSANQSLEWPRFWLVFERKSVKPRELRGRSICFLPTAFACSLLSHCKSVSRTSLLPIFKRFN